MNDNMGMLKKMVIYFFGSVASKIITFLMMPLITSVIVASEQGIANTISAGLNAVVPVCFISCWSGVMRFMFDREETNGRRMVFGNGLAIMTVMFPLYIGGIVLLGLFVPLEYAAYPFWVVTAYGIAQALQYLYQFSARGLGMNTLYMVTGVINTVITAACNVLFVLVLRWGYVSLLIAPTIGAFSVALIFEWKTRLMLNTRWHHLSPELLMRLTKYCIPLAINSVAYWLMNTANQLVVSNVLGAADAGLYGIAAQFSQILALATTVFALAWEETTYANSADAQRGQLYRNTLRQYLLLLGLGMAMLVPMTKVVFPFMARDISYAQAIWIIPVKYLGTMANAVSNYYGNIYAAEKQVVTILTSTILGAAVNIILMIVLIPLIGLQGAVIALLVGFLANTVMRHIRAQRFCKIPFPWMTLTRVAVVNIVAFAAYYLCDVWVNFAMAVLAAFYALFTLRGLIRQLWDKIKKRKEGV